MILTEEGALQFRKVLELITDSLQELMNIADEMVPEKLLTHGLKNFLIEYCSLLESENKIKINLSFPVEWLRAGETIETEIYRIIRYLISFSLKNKASVIDLTFSQTEKILNLNITDNNLTYENLSKSELITIESIIESSGANMLLKEDNRINIEFKNEH